MNGGARGTQRHEQSNKGAGCAACRIGSYHPDTPLTHAGRRNTEHRWATHYSRRSGKRQEGRPRHGGDLAEPASLHVPWQGTHTSVTVAASSTMKYSLCWQAVMQAWLGTRRKACPRVKEDKSTGCGASSDTTTTPHSWLILSTCNHNPPPIHTIPNTMHIHNTSTDATTAECYCNGGE